MDGSRTIDLGLERGLPIFTPFFFSVLVYLSSILNSVFLIFAFHYLPSLVGYPHIPFASESMSGL